jgi:hypothetical protein
MRRLIVTTALAVSLLSAGASAAVPETKYACYGEGSIFISSLKVKSETKYNYLGDNGKYEFKKAGKVLHFKSGPLKPWVGHLYKSAGDPAIELTTDKAGGQIVQCYS